MDEDAVYTYEGDIEETKLMYMQEMLIAQARIYDALVTLIGVVGDMDTAQNLLKQHANGLFNYPMIEE